MTDDRALRFILKPTEGRVTVRVKDVEKETKSGLILVGTTHAEKPTTGVVDECCDLYSVDGVDYEPLFKKGEIVVFGKFSGTKVQVDRETYIILKETDIVARLVPSNDPAAVEPDKVKVRAPAEG